MRATARMAQKDGAKRMQRIVQKTAFTLEIFSFYGVRLETMS
jgi:hypothetical protein